MTNLKLTLVDVDTQSDAKITLEVEGLTNNTVLYQCESPGPLEFLQPNEWLFKLRNYNRIDNTNYIQLTPNTPKLHYFFLAVNPLPNIQASAPETYPLKSIDAAYVLQVRMDVTVIVIIEDVNVLDKLKTGGSLKDVTIIAQTNNGNCTTLSLPQLTSTQDTYIIAYHEKNDISKYRLLQKAICTFNDARTPLIHIPNIGIELFASPDKSSSYQAEEVEIMVYGIDKSNIPYHWKQSLF